MSSELERLMKTARDLQPLLEHFENEWNEVEDNTDRYSLDSESRYAFGSLYQVEEKLSDALHLLKALNKPTKVEGSLQKNSNGRYEVGRYELTSGAPVEFWYEDEDGGYYIPSRIEHSGDYYIVGIGKNKDIDGVKVRIK